jgi:hypothetical protein
VRDQAKAVFWAEMQPALPALVRQARQAQRTLIEAAWQIRCILDAAPWPKPTEAGFVEADNCRARSTCL